jgi:uncharacterized protein (DUF362 family)
MSDCDDRSHVVRRRQLLGSAAAAAMGLAAGRADGQPASAPPSKERSGVTVTVPNPIARPPQGFVPLSLPGRIVRVDKANTLQDNGLWPKQEAATAMLERAMAELTGESDLGRAFAKFVHPADRVAIKPNGIAGRKGATMAANKELVLAIVRGVIAAGVPASSIHIYEQYPSFMAGTRVADKAGVIDPDFPAGITTSVHENKDAMMDEVPVAGGKTRYVRAFMNATAVINVTQIKDHGICGYTGTLKNITHGSIVNPHDFHAHNASPQIAQLYAQRIVTSRVRLHVTDGFKLIYDEGPLDKNPARRIPHEAVYVCTDPVAMDVIGWGVVEKHRRDAGLPTLKDAGREPTYIRVAGELGLGVFDQNHIRMREVRI